MIHAITVSLHPEIVAGSLDYENRPDAALIAAAPFCLRAPSLSQNVTARI
jgi:hypothetical protein